MITKNIKELEEISKAISGHYVTKGELIAAIKNQLAAWKELKEKIETNYLDEIFVDCELLGDENVKK